jgi:hypothetical protein
VLVRLVRAGFARRRALAGACLVLMLALSRALALRSMRARVGARTIGAVMLAHHAAAHHGVMMIATHGVHAAAQAECKRHRAKS